LQINNNAEVSSDTGVAWFRTNLQFGAISSKPLAMNKGFDTHG
jgi:hypothetical protein